MAHEIWGSRFTSRQKHGWHGLGDVFDIDEVLTVVDAFNRARANYTVSRREIFASPDEGVSLDKVEGVAMLYRDATEDSPAKQLGIVSDAYRILQPLKAAAAIDATGLSYPVETCGVLHEGETIFCALRGGNYAVADVDEIESYFVIEINLAPGKSNRILHTPVRVVCRNTLTMAYSNSNINFAIPSVGDPEAMLTFATQLASDFEGAKEDAQKLFNLMAKTPITDEQLEYVLAAAYKYPAKPKKANLLAGFTPEQIMLMKGTDKIAGTDKTGVTKQIIESVAEWQYKCSRIDVFRDGARELFEKFNDEHSFAARTMWAAYNAVTECSDWRNGSGDVAESVLFGDRAAEKRRGFEAIVEHMSISNN